MLDAILALAGGYLLGSIPFAYIVTQAFGLGDIRQVGSGNVGTTNVLRTGNKLATTSRPKGLPSPTGRVQLPK